ARRPPGLAGLWEVSLALVYTVPVVALFNYTSYTTEKHQRERFVLRSVLRDEHRHHVSLAVVRPRSPENGGGGDGGGSGSGGGSGAARAAGRHARARAGAVGRGRLLLGLTPWAALALGRRIYLEWDWELLVRVLFADKMATHIAFTHFVGAGLFLMIATRKVRFFFAVPAIGATLLSVAAQAPLSPHTLQLSLTGVGHGMLALTAVFALGAVGWIVAGWQELVSFVRRTCFLHPVEAEESMRHYPVLRRLITAAANGGDCEAAAAAAAVAATAALGAGGGGARQAKSALALASPPGFRGARASRRGTAALSRPPSAGGVATMATVDVAPGVTVQEGDATCLSENDNVGPPIEACNAAAAAAAAPTVLHLKGRGSCGFCGGTAPAYLVPVCRRWGLWALWRRELDDAVGRARAQRAPGGEEAVLAAARAGLAAPCTTYADLAEARAVLERRLAEAAAERAGLERRLA
ncbi:unnamed protein product, partial [Phaeothamnion confervicola]